MDAPRLQCGSGCTGMQCIEPKRRYVWKMLTAISNKTSAMWLCGNARLKGEWRLITVRRQHFACEQRRKIAKSCHGERGGTKHTAGAAAFVVPTVFGGDILRLWMGRKLMMAENNLLSRLLTLNPQRGVIVDRAWAWAEGKSLSNKSSSGIPRWWIKRLPLRGRLKYSYYVAWCAA